MLRNAFAISSGSAGAATFEKIIIENGGDLHPWCDGPTGPAPMPAPPRTPASCSVRARAEASIIVKIHGKAVTQKTEHFSYSALASSHGTETNFNLNVGLRRFRVGADAHRFQEGGGMGGAK